MNILQHTQVISNDVPYFCYGNRLWTPDRNSFLYGLIAGLLPVVALAVLTALIPIVIRLVAVK